MMHSLLIEKLCSGALTALAIFFLSDEKVQQLFIVLGQGHFIAAYLYRWKAGKIGAAYITRYILIFVALIASYEYYRYDFELEIITALYFTVHFLVDERYLKGGTPLPKGLLLLLPFFLLFMGYVLDYRLHLGMSRPLVLVSLVISLATVAAFIARRFVDGILLLYFQILYLLLVAVYPIHDTLPLNYLIGSIVLFHYFNWYLHYALRYSADRRKFRSYVYDMLFVNALVLSAYFFFRANDESIFRYFFRPSYFYIWTLMHLVFTTRRSDWPFLYGKG